MKFVVFVVAVLVPLLIAPGLLFHFDITPKIAVLLLGASVLPVFFGAGILRDLHCFAATAPGRRLMLLIAAQFLWLTAATVLSTHRELSLNGSGWRRYGLMTAGGLLLFTLFTAAWLARDNRRIEGLLRVLAVTGGVASAYGIGQYFGIDPFQSAKSYQVGEAPFLIVRTPGTLGHADYFAAWLAPVVFIALGAGRLYERTWQRAGYSLVAGMAVCAVVLSGTRAALFALIAGTIAMFALGAVRLRLRPITATVGLAAIGLFVMSPAGAKLRARVFWSSQDPLGGARLLLWRDSLRMATARPWFGFGPETFATEFPRYQSLDLARAYPDFYHESPHNVFLDQLVSQGIPGALILVATFVLALQSGFIARNKRYPLAVPLLAALVAALVGHQFVVFVVPTALAAYLLVAMSVAFAGSPETAAKPLPFPAWTLRLGGVAAGIALTVFATRLTLADYWLAVADRRIAMDDARSAGGAYRKYLESMPAGANDSLYYSRAMASLARRSPLFGVKIEALQAAVDSGVLAAGSAEDRQNAWCNLAILFAARNDAQGTERALRNAIAWAPNWFKPHWTLAQLLDLSHRRREAITEANAAVERDGAKHNEVLATLAKLKLESR